MGKSNVIMTSGWAIIRRNLQIIISTFKDLCFHHCQEMIAIRKNAQATPLSNSVWHRTNKISRSYQVCHWEVNWEQSTRPHGRKNSPTLWDWKYNMTFARLLLCTFYKYHNMGTTCFSAFHNINICSTGWSRRYPQNDAGQSKQPQWHSMMQCHCHTAGCTQRSRKSRILSQKGLYPVQLWNISASIHQNHNARQLLCKINESATTKVYNSSTLIGEMASYLIAQQQLSISREPLAMHPHRIKAFP